MKKIGLFFGGLSNEADISVLSARNVARHLDEARYRIILIYWNRSDRRFYRVRSVSVGKLSERDRLPVEDFSKTFDVALLMTHGRYGEDGVLQAILEAQGVKFCGCGVLASALCMDKARLKDFMAVKGIRQVRYQVLDHFSFTRQEIAAARRKISTFHFPLYIKPSNSGSSVGITKVENKAGMDKAIRQARIYDQRVIVEEGLVNPKEIEIGIIGNDKLTVSRPGQLYLAKEFYDYDDKYKLGQAQAIVPADLSSVQEKAVQDLAARAYRLAGCRGFARVDLFLSGNKIYLNEINTLPGFTDTSMFPLVMTASGLSYKDLLSRIIELAVKAAIS